ncbi:MAG: formate--tetrahydrofolate ligase [Candidatus Omnitrophica bacterium]|nr:formate--tetrahydrofolate ligase [Candidatus Omnitrophota bacterium]MBU4472807.1 formate--tetrahydrofolate ligase [Candidatus Omnitrophota bacterium]MCG2706000.1 formate--tetrahydrofolate ligase [Candidatus Omnitrophota bacterium]
MLPDIKIAQAAKKEPIGKIARKLKIDKRYLIPYGDYIAKIDLGILDKIKKRPRGKYILVTAITPTPLGEGKTVTTIGLSMALNRLGKLTSACIRQPSLGPVFGIKGGAAGGGYSQVLPMEDFNLHFTGDVHAIGLAHNLAAAFLDNSLLKGNKLSIDPERIYWRRVVDVSDRALRNIKIGLGGKKDGVPRDSGFDITVASEIMVIIALSSGLGDLRQRIGKIILADTSEGKSITTQGLKVAGSMTALLKDALKPNLIQTIENTPCFVHAGPFANIAHGNSSILADRIALACSDYVVTEAGFGADCGAEKFFDIKCRQSGLVPDAAVIVCSIRALKAHSGRFKIIAGKPLDEGLVKENIAAIEEGLCNLEKHIENIKIFGIPVVVAVNRFSSDTDQEVDFVKKKAMEFGADDCQMSEVWLKGSKGGVDLARSVIKAAALPKKFTFLYPLDTPIKEKIKIIATSIYGAADVEYSELAEGRVKLFTERGFDNLPICMAKTHLSLSHDPDLKGRPRDFILPIRDIRASAGAGFLYPLCGTMQTMPGLPSHPVGEGIDIDEKGNITGLS